MTADRNLVFPIDRINQLAENGVVSSVNHRHISVMGSIITPETLINESAPQIAQLLKDDGVDLTLLIPVWPVCNQTVGLIASEIERTGIATVTIQLLKEVAVKVRPPRSLWVPFPHGYSLGQPNAPQRQFGVMQAALQLFQDSGASPPILVNLNEVG